MNVIVRALACAAFVAATPAAATNILDNSGFETGSLTPWYQANSFSSGTDWFVTNSYSESGGYSAEDTGNKELRQDFAGVLGSTIDQVGFWARHPNSGTNSALAYIFYYSDNSNSQFLVNLTGVDWNFFDVTAQLDTTKTLTGFSIYGNSSQDPRYAGGPVTLADNFVIDVAGGVPEPGTWAMMMLGFGLTGLAIRRRRRVSAALA